MNADDRSVAQGEISTAVDPILMVDLDVMA
jgi:hypothetical protein